MLVGTTVTVQTGLNTNLKKRLLNPLLVALISFSLCSVCFFVLLLLSEGSIALPYNKLIGQPFWAFIPGIFGIVYLTGNMMIFPRLGNILAVICVSAGQVLAGILIDHFGLFRMAVRPMNGVRILGAFLALIGVVIVALAKEEGKERRDQSFRLTRFLWCGYGLFTGAIVTAQSAVNSYVGRLTGSMVKAGTMSTIEAVPILILLVFLLKKKIPTDFSGFKRTKLWMYPGGFCGTAFVFLNAYLSARIGVGLTVIAALFGSMLSGIVIDAFGFFGYEKKKATPKKLLGVVILFTGAVLVRLL